MRSYESMLQEAYNKIKVVLTSRERFEIPKVEGKVQGKSTVITNINEIASYIRRNADHLAKFLQKELATCTECKKPDTEIISEKGIKFKNCLACGAKSPVRYNL